MKTSNPLITRVFSGLVAGLAISTCAALADTFEVTVTNITAGQSFTPRLAVTHAAGRLFTLGKPALPELAAIAEAGDLEPLMTLLDAMPDLVTDMQVGEGLLLPGESHTMMLEGDPGDLFTMVFMLVPTNDGFSGVNAGMLPETGSMTWHASVYDAGSEPNDELCVNIPGPVCGGEGGSPEEAGEGYVYVHPGISGEGDLAAGEYDWNNPAAVISVTRL